MIEAADDVCVDATQDATATGVRPLPSGRVHRCLPGFMKSLTGDGAAPSSAGDVWDELSDDPDAPDASPPIHRIVPAAGTALPKAAGPRSIFDAGDGLPKPAGRGAGNTPIAWTTRKVQVADGVLQRFVIRPQETAEWAEREQARRARQKVPRTPWKRRVGKKLAALIGAERE